MLFWINWCMTRFASCLLSNNSVVHLYTMQISCMMPFYRKFQQMWHQRVMAACSCAKPKTKTNTKTKTFVNPGFFKQVWQETSTLIKYRVRSSQAFLFPPKLMKTCVDFLFFFLSHEKDIRDRIDDAAVACVYFYCACQCQLIWMVLSIC